MRLIATQLMLWLLPLSLFSQGFITGKVSSEAGKPVEGAEVSLARLGKITFTDAEGKFKFESLPQGSYLLNVNALGYAKESREVKLGSDGLKLDIGLIRKGMMEDVLITSLRANEKTATTYTTLEKEEVEAQNFGQDFPFLLDQLASTVVTSDAGAGVGYTGIRIRGSDPTRINVTINGIPLNDSESHGVFWVNLPDLASSVNSVQVQRGVGTSTNGGAAFGASINIQTSQVAPEPFVLLDNSAGSFNTLKNTLSLGSGLLDNGFAFEARLSNVQSDGYLDRARSDLQSWFVSGGYYGEKTFLKANVFSGNERTFQSWYGVPEALIEGDEEALLNHYFNNKGSIYLTPEDSVNLFSSDRRYNYYTYEDQVDNYGQTHYQLHFGHDFLPNLNLSAALHYTRGRGFFEEFREEDPLGAYPPLGVNPLVVGGDTLGSTDLVRRRWLDNHFYGTVFTLNYDPQQNLNLTLGGGINQYDGDHFGEIIWAKYAGESEIGDRYYYSRSLKVDGNLYFKALYEANDRLSAYVDLQVRGIDYQLGDSVLSEPGRDNHQQRIQGSYSYTFFNPKVGLTYNFNPSHQAYISLAVGNREPVRSDFVNSPTGEETLPETLYDLEAGYRFGSRRASLSANLYYMYYENQLVLTGALNDVGANIRQNVDVSYRAGIELVGELELTDWLDWGANLTLSQNKIRQFEEVIYDYANFPATEDRISYSQTDISFSPNVIASSQLDFHPFSGFNFLVVSKYVGEQYLDNTSNPDRVLDAFFVNDIQVNYTFQTSWMKEINLGLLVNNVLDTEYEANGYTYSYRFGELITENFYYPQAGRNFLLRLVLKI